MRTLLVDNHDSYTFNLFQLIAEVSGTEPVVVVNDDPALATMPLDGFANVVISPGPGRPQHARDVGRLADLLRRTTLPVLGVCLGHQVIAHLAGGTVTSAPQPRHGHLTTVRHGGDDLFDGIPAEFTAVRYHSLCVREPLPDELVATAWAEDGVLMALRHRDLPRWGVQFHPESVASEYGHEIIRNFAELTGPGDRRRQARARSTAGDLRLISTVVPSAVDTESVFTDLFQAAPDCCWLDSAVVEPGLARFSFLGAASGPLGEVLTYRVGSGAVRVRDATGVRLVSGSVFDVLDQRLRDRRLPATDLPFDLTCGYVGYFGYELKADDGATTRHTADTPDAAWLFADRMIVVDHEEHRTYVLAVHDDRTREQAREWVDSTAARLAALRPVQRPPEPTGPAPRTRWATRPMSRSACGNWSTARATRSA
jgi:para-aminobenzoate synthetase